MIPKFFGRKEFQISLKHVINVERLMVSIYLKTLTEQLFNDVRNGKNLTIDDIKDILKSEVRNYQWFNKDGRWIVDDCLTCEELVGVNYRRWWDLL